MNESARPKRVLFVDAETPLVEISGDFYWLEDHGGSWLRPVSRRMPRGMSDGIAAAAAQGWPRTVVVRYRRGRLRRVITTVFVAFIVLAYVISLISGMVAPVHSP